MNEIEKTGSETIEAVLNTLDSQPSEPEIDNYYHDHIYSILKEKHKREIIKSDDKHLARRETMKLILNSVKFRGRKRGRDFKLRSDIVVPGDIERKRMKKQQKKYGKPLA